uniref:probable NADH dehydrogenase [ubiquinone] 1 alpha subcomplex subunit 5, mitochondrial n=1 Tax=Erigeron canadensis TaxID=72917 RepID=UPI001CB92BC4|nr:probable NADH dehydrogenase [ubiquinone] 1 alpha subcomplex subunit 5, mitochondrial [Erigeron canadensis]XP_043630619.1 probable NADH dehydrogenase [ubiquinone] 1 alpha subcomplex subunit 5, mitochondrial [Erigeron canadensis]
MFIRKFARASMTMMMSEGTVAAESSTAGRVGELIRIYKRTMEEIKSLPEQEGYRKAVEATTRKRLEICLEEQDPEAIEKRIGCGKFEEVVMDAKFEFKVACNLHHWDPWKKDLTYVCYIWDDDDEVAVSSIPGPIPDELYERLKALKAIAKKDEQITMDISEDSCSKQSNEMFSSVNNS